MLTIDGGYLEGGGQIVRTATALAAIRKIPCQIINIRKGRPNPGLATQHLLGLQALAQLCNGKLEGDYLGSEEIRFYPGEIRKEKISLSIPTAASLTLIFQSLIPPALFVLSPLKISFEGGATDTFFSPTIDYFQFVFLKILEKIGVKIKVEVLKRGYFPAGGSKVIVEIFPSKLKPINLTERGEFKKILIFSRAAEELKKRKVAERQAVSAQKIFEKLKLPIETKIEYQKTDCPGSSIFTAATFSNTILGFDNLGKIGKRSEEIGEKCAISLLGEEKSKACLDRFMADQILIYMALTGKKSQVTVSEITSHLKTNIWVIEKFIDGKFEIKENLISWSSF